MKASNTTRILLFHLLICHIKIWYLSTWSWNCMGRPTASFNIMKFIIIYLPLHFPSLSYSPSPSLWPSFLPRATAINDVQKLCKPTFKLTIGTSQLPYKRPFYQHKESIFNLGSLHFWLAGNALKKSCKKYWHGSFDCTVIYYIMLLHVGGITK